MTSQCSSDWSPLVVFVAAVAVFFLLVAAPYAVRATEPGDISGDGISDLMVGVPGEDVSGWTEAGMMAEMLGSEYGFSASACDWWSPDFSLVNGSAGHDEFFAEALTMGDFNGDGFADVAIGITGEVYSPGSVFAAGAVHVVYGHTGGLSVFNQQVFDQGTAGIVGGPEEDDRFGSVLTAGDFDGDGFADLVIGIPYEDNGSLVNSGYITVLYGASQGLVTAGSLVIDQSHPGLPGDVEAGDRFGGALATGDFDGDGYSDLAVGSPHEDIGAVVRAGAVHILYGSSSGLTTSDSQMWYQGNDSIRDTSEADDRFGSDLVAGDFDNDGYEDLAVGIPGEDVGALNSAGAVAVIWGSNNGLTGADDQHLTETDCGEGTSEANDVFGAALTAGDFNGDGLCDLAIGAPGEGYNVSNPNTGAVTVLYGHPLWFQGEGNQLWFQGVGGLLGNPETGDGFGFSLAAGEFNGDDFVDLAIGAPFEDLNGQQEAGVITIMYGTANGLVGLADESWSQQTLGWAVESYDFFGWALASGWGSTSSGPEIFSDGFESGDTSRW